MLCVGPFNPGFKAGLQECIVAARPTIDVVQRHRSQHHPLFAPVFVSVIWMSGLIIAFACQIGQHETEKGFTYISHSFPIEQLFLTVMTVIRGPASILWISWQSIAPDLRHSRRY